MRPITIYKIGLVWIFPIFLAVHGLIWVTTYTSSSFAVYAMKLALLPFVALGLLAYSNQIFRYRKMLTIAYPASIVITSSLVVPFTIPDDLNIFYYVADTIGALIFFLSIAIFYVGLRRGSITIVDMEQIAIRFLIVVSIYIIIYFVVSGGQKVNLPPEMNLSISILFGAYFFRLPEHSRIPHWIAVLVALACVLSQFRLNIGVFGITVISCLLRALFFNRLRKSLVVLIVLLFMSSLAAAPLYWSILSDRLDSLRLAESSSSSASPEIFEDPSLNQRFVESSLILVEMSDPAYSQILGKGAGAQFDNLGNVLEHYGERIHHSHSTPHLIFLRMGLVGVILYFAPMVIGLFSIFSRDDFVFRSSLSLVLFYMAQFLDQYVFWGVQFASCLALWLYSFDRRKADKARNLIRRV